MTLFADSVFPASDIGSARKILFELQVEQHKHDENYHREIARLSLHQRLNHMALHFAKYTGKIAATNNTTTLRHIYVDTLIIALSSANILNVELWELLETDEREYPGLLAFGRALALTVPPCSDQTALIAQTAVATGKIAAACEKIDHLEEISFRTEIKAGVAMLSTIALAYLAQQGCDPAISVRQRLGEVKQRLKLHGRI